MASQAKSLGFRIEVVLVGTDSVEINIERVRARVTKGGHDVPEADQRWRWPRTLKNMQRLVPLADAVVVLDNSTEQGFVRVGTGTTSFIKWSSEVPTWAKPLQAKL